MLSSHFTITNIKISAIITIRGTYFFYSKYFGGGSGIPFTHVVRFVHYQFTKYLDDSLKGKPLDIMERLCYFQKIYSAIFNVQLKSDLTKRG